MIVTIIIGVWVLIGSGLATYAIVKKSNPFTDLRSYFAETEEEEKKDDDDNNDVDDNNNTVNNGDNNDNDVPPPPPCPYELTFGQCLRPLDAGETCPIPDAVCSDDLFCNMSTNKCSAYLQENEEGCTEPQKLCADGLRCKENTCVPIDGRLYFQDGNSDNWLVCNKSDLDIVPDSTGRSRVGNFILDNDPRLIISETVPQPQPPSVDGGSSAQMFGTSEAANFFNTCANNSSCHTIYEQDGSYQTFTANNTAYREYVARDGCEAIKVQLSGPNAPCTGGQSKFIFNLQTAHRNAFDSGAYYFYNGTPVRGSVRKLALSVLDANRVSVADFVRPMTSMSESPVAYVKRSKRDDLGVYDVWQVNAVDVSDSSVVLSIKYNPIEDTTAGVSLASNDEFIFTISYTQTPKTDGMCEPGLVCVDGRCASGNQRLGDVCADDLLCERGLVCENGRCKSMAGGTCFTSVNGVVAVSQYNCASGLNCKDTQSTVCTNEMTDAEKQTCMCKVPLGSVCTERDHCEQKDGTEIDCYGKCLITDGRACEASFECDSGLCVDGNCVRESTTECTFPYVCKEGFVCDEGQCIPNNRKEVRMKVAFKNTVEEPYEFDVRLFDVTHTPTPVQRLRSSDVSADGYFEFIIEQCGPSQFGSNGCNYNTMSNNATERVHIDMVGAVDANIDQSNSRITINGTDYPHVKFYNPAIDCKEGLCFLTYGEGESCANEDGVCGYPLICVRGVCTRMKDAGETCSSNEQCDGVFLCKRNKCEHPECVELTRNKVPVPGVSFGAITDQGEQAQYSSMACSNVPTCSEASIMQNQITDEKWKEWFGSNCAHLLPLQSEVGGSCMAPVASGCDFGLNCENGTCVKPDQLLERCSENIGCEEGLVCYNGQCRSEAGGTCSTENDCGPSLACDNNKCKNRSESVCDDENVCARGLTCVNGKCSSGALMACSVDEDCMDGMACLDNKCYVLPGNACVFSDSVNFQDSCRSRFGDRVKCQRTEDDWLGHAGICKIMTSGLCENDSQCFRGTCGEVEGENRCVRMSESICGWHGEEYHACESTHICDTEADTEYNTKGKCIPRINLLDIRIELWPPYDYTNIPVSIDVSLIDTQGRVYTFNTTEQVIDTYVYRTQFGTLQRVEVNVRNWDMLSQATQDYTKSKFNAQFYGSVRVDKVVQESTYWTLVNTNQTVCKNIAERSWNGTRHIGGGQTCSVPSNPGLPSEVGAVCEDTSCALVPTNKPVYLDDFQEDSYPGMQRLCGCDNKLLCENGTCQAPSTVGAVCETVCGDGLVCENNRCVADLKGTCVLDSDCLATLSCVGGKCDLPPPVCDTYNGQCTTFSTESGFFNQVAGKALDSITGSLEDAKAACADSEECIGFDRNNSSSTFVLRSSSENYTQGSFGYTSYFKQTEPCTKYACDMNGECNDTYTCKEGLTCTGASETQHGTCTAPGFDQKCLTNCSTGLECVDHICKKMVGQYCASAEQCTSQLCEIVPLRDEYNPVCITRGGVGETCNAGTRLCEEGLSCEGVEGSKTCKSAPDSGCTTAETCAGSLKGKSCKFVNGGTSNGACSTEYLEKACEGENDNNAWYGETWERRGYYNILVNGAYVNQYCHRY